MLDRPEEKRLPPMDDGVVQCLVDCTGKVCPVANVFQVGLGG